MEEHKVAILGTGWLGLPLGRALVVEGYTVYGSTRHPEKQTALQAAGIRPFHIDLQPGVIGREQDTFFGVQTLVLNIPPGRNEPESVRNYSTAVKNAVDAARNAGVKNVLFTSSTSVYGEQNGPVTEETPAEPATDSAKAILQAEQYLRERSGLQVTILRLGGLVGPDRHPGRWFAGKKDLADGNHVINLVHLTDVVGVMRRVIAGNHWGLTLNVSADQHPTKAEFYPLAAQALGVEPPTFLANATAPVGKRISSEKAKKVLGYEFSYADPRLFPELHAGSRE